MDPQIHDYCSYKYEQHLELTFLQKELVNICKQYVEQPGFYMGVSTDDYIRLHTVLLHCFNKNNTFANFDNSTKHIMIENILNEIDVEKRMKGR
jgi:hypothetical protein